MIHNLNISQGLRSLAVGLLGTTAALTFGVPPEAQAQTFVPGSYGYAYQQITNLRALFTKPTTFIDLGSNTVGNAAIDPSSFPPSVLALSNIVDTPESYVGPPGSGANAGLGNNFGFFSQTTSQTFSSQKGQVNPDYSRGDAQLAGVQTSQDLVNGLFGNGLNFANVAESYVNSAKKPIPNSNFLTTQGNAVGRYTLSSNNFTLAAPLGVAFSYDWRNELYVELGQNTPMGAPLGNQANANLIFEIVINQIVGGTATEVFRFAPLDNNFGLGITQEGQQNAGANFGNANSNFVANLCQGNINQGVCVLPAGTYQLQIAGEEKVDTRIVEIPEPLTMFGAATAAGFGAFFKRQLKNKQQKEKA